MTLRKRLSLIAAASVAAAVLIAIVVCYMVVRSELHSSIDNSLTAQAQGVQGGDWHSLSQLPGTPSASAGGPAPYAQIVLATGDVHGVAGNGGATTSGNIYLPVSRRTLAVASGTADGYFSTVQIHGVDMRMITFQAQLGQYGPGAVQLARPLNGVESILSSLRLIFALLLAAGIAIAAALGRVAARRVLRPLGEVAEAARHIGETDDLSRRIRVHADDEVGELARRFNTMLDRLEGSRAALDASMRSQRQLVADASHELRTPVTSLRTNIEVLLEGGELDEEERRRLLADVVEQSEELTALVGDLIELARGDQPSADTEDVRLDGVAAEALARARRNAPGIRFEATLEPTLIDGAPDRLARAINNLLDNAARHSPPGGTVEVRVDPKGVVVRDHGPGVPREDQPYVFDRFFRGRNSRGRQGSGLGLAIVRQVTEQHGGSVSVTNAPDGGAVFTLRLPGAPADAPGGGPEPGGPGQGGGTGAPTAEPAQLR